MKIIEKGELIFLCKFLEKNMDVGFGENWFFFFFTWASGFGVS